MVTTVDRETSWPEAVPTNSITAEAVAKILVETWVARFGAPARITIDKGCQFESELFKSLASRLGCHKMHTTLYHPQSNGKVDRWHRSLKAAMYAYATPNWVDLLPLILLGLRTTINSDTGVSAAQLTYGSELRLSGEFFVSVEDRTISNPGDFVQQLSTSLSEFARQTRHHGKSPVFVPAELSSYSHIFLRAECRQGLQPPYTGPHKVIRRDTKTITIIVNGKQ